MSLLTAWSWLLLTLVPLVVVERWIHRHLQGIWLLLLRDADMALVVYSLIMLPGVLVHEGSHWLAATLLGVRAGRFSVVPERLPDGTLRLGYVETQKADFLRESLIGAAPLIFGTAAIIAVGYFRLGVGPAGQALANGDLIGMALSMRAMTALPDFWLWIYFIFTVSNSMLPSASDRRAWLPLLALVAVVSGLVFYAGFGALLVDAISEPLDYAMRALASAFTITLALNLFLAPFIWAFERVLMRFTGLKVEY
jgi:hypothetical protein